MTSLDELIRWLAAPEPSQRVKLQTLLDHHVAAIRGLRDDHFATAIRDIKKRLSSPKLADQLAALMAALTADRAAHPAPVAPAVDAPPVRWAATSNDERLTALEAIVAADPDAQPPYLVLADHLAAAGDARAELITIGHALAKNPAHKAMRLADEQWRERNRELLWGSFLIQFEHCVRDIEWYLGFIRACEVREAPQHATAGDLVVAVLDDPGPGRFIQRLTTASVDGCHAIAAALARRPRPTLRELSLGEPWHKLGDLAPLWSAADGLRALSLVGIGLQLGAPRAPRLERLAIDFGAEQSQANDNVATLAPLIATTAELPALRTLVVHDCEFADEWIEQLVDAPLLGQLHELDLTGGTLSSRGGELILAHHQRFAHLTKLDLELNYLPGQLARKLAALGAFVHIGDQREDDGEPRVAANGE